MATARLRSVSSLRGILLLRRCSAVPAAAALVTHVSDFQSPGCVTWRHFSTYKPNPLAKGDNFGSTASLYSQAAWASHATAVKETEDSYAKISIGPKPKEIKEDDEDGELVHDLGLESPAIKILKYLSLLACGGSWLIVPCAIFIPIPDWKYSLEVEVASTVISIGIPTATQVQVAYAMSFLSTIATVAIFCFFRSQIHKLRWRQGSDSFVAEMIPWLAKPLKKTIKFADIRDLTADSGVIKFIEEGEFYVARTRLFKNRAFLERLTPKHLHESAFKNL